MVNGITCFTVYSSPSRFTCKTCSILYVTSVVFTIGGTRQVTVAAIHPKFTLQTSSTLYVTCAIFTGDGTGNVTVGAINIVFFYILIWIKTAILHIGNPTSFFFNAYKPFRLLNYLSLIMLYIKSTYLYVPYLFCSNYIFRIWDFGNQNQSYSV